MRDHSEQNADNCPRTVIRKGVNIFRDFETNGELYQVPIYVEMSGILYNDALLGNKHAYSISDLMSAVDTLPSDIQLFPAYSYEEMLDIFLPVMMTSFVSDENGTCQFDRV